MISNPNLIQGVYKMNIEHILVINSKLASTNNGKLMLHNLSVDERKALPELIKRDFYCESRFLEWGDSIKMGRNNPFNISGV
jgi:DNA-directed RNA polymerase subunit H (RpoH/RPB5)